MTGPLERMMTGFVLHALCFALCLSLSKASDSDHPLALDGVIVAQDPMASVALVRRTDGGRARPLRIGQERAGYVLVAVERDSVLLEGPEGPLRLYLSGRMRLEPGSADARMGDRREEQRWVRRAFSKEEAQRRLEKEIGVILSETRLDPHLENGEVAGLRVGRLPDGTLLSESGLLPGDVLLSLNDAPLSDLDSLWETLAHLDGEDELRLVLERRGEIVRLAYDLVH